MPLCYLFSTRGPNARATYIVHLSTMCHIFDGSARPAIFVCWLARKTQTWYTPVGRWDLAFCQVSLNLVQQFQRRSPKYLRKSEAGRLSCFFPIGQKKKKNPKTKTKTQTWYRTLRCCFLSSFVQFGSAVSEEKSTMSYPSEARAAILLFPSTRKTQPW